MRMSRLHALAWLFWLSLSGSLAFTVSCADEDKPVVATNRSGLRQNIWTEDFESEATWASHFNTVTGNTATNSPPNNYVGSVPVSSGAPSGSTRHLLLRAGSSSSGVTTPTYAYEIRKQIDTAVYRNITLTFYRILTGLDGPTTVNNLTLTDRWVVRYATVASPGANDWIIAQASTTDNTSYALQTISSLPASSTLWISFLADFRPTEPTNNNYVFDESAILDNIVLAGDVCQTNADCNDGVECTNDQCNVSTGACTNAPRTAGYGCNDRPIMGGTASGFCDGTGDCVQCVVAGNCTNDNNLCTNGPVCTDNVCSNGPAVNCSDGLFCNGSESCSPSTGCQAGTPPTLTDGIACTTDACNETVDQVVHIPVDSVCNDSNPCTDDQCSTTTDCSNEPIAAGGACEDGYCDATGMCVECLSDGQCPSGLECEDNQCTCTLLTCPDLPAGRCGLFPDGCGGLLDCRARCDSGSQLCDMSNGYENGLCSAMCDNTLRDPAEEGRDCGGPCARPCFERVCGGGLDEDSDGDVDCDDLDCVDAGACDPCAQRRLGVASWPETINPAVPFEPAEYRYSLIAPGCSAHPTLGPFSVVGHGGGGKFEISRTDAAFTPFLTCLLQEWENIDAGAALQPQVRLRVVPVDDTTPGSPLEVDIPLRELLAFDAHKGQVESFRLVVRSGDYTQGSTRLSFSWEAVGFTDTQSDCRACTAFDDDAIDLDFCTEQCRCDIGEGGCSSDDECRRGLVCEPRGSWFGYHVPGLSVCVPAYCADGVLNGDEGEMMGRIDCGGARCGTCPDCNDEPGCTASCPCQQYEGPCTSNAECGTGLACGNDNGHRLGLPHLDRVCWPTACESPSGCGTPACGPCDDCTFIPAGCQVTPGPAQERLRFGSSSMRATPASFVNVMDLVEEVGPHALRTKAGGGDTLSLFEGSATNYALQSTDLMQWTPGNVTRTEVSAPAVGSNVHGVRASVIADTSALNQSVSRNIIFGTPPNQPVSASAWIRRQSGSSTAGSVALVQSATTASRAFTSSSDWTRFDATGLVTEADVDAHFALNVWGMASTASPYILDIALPQVELGTFPTSWIASYGTPKHRDRDRVVIDRGMVAPWLYRGTFTVQVEPLFGSADLATRAQTFVLIEYGASDQWLGFQSNGAGLVELVAVAGAQRIALPLPAFARNVASTITVSPATGELRSTLTASVASGPPWRWPEQSLSIGARSSGTTPDSAYAWIGQPRTSFTVPATCTTQLYPDRQSCGEGAEWCVAGRCVVSALCGNGLLDDDGADAPIEGCDDGNKLAGDGCSPECHPEPISFQVSDVAVHEPGVRVHHLGVDGADRLLLVWQALDGEGTKLVARRLNAGGEVATDDDEEPLEIEVGLPGAWPAEPQVVGLAAGGWVVVWATPSAASGASRIALRVVALDGTLSGVSYVSTERPDLAQVELEPRVAQLAQGFVLAWVDTSTTGVDHRVLRGRLFGADARPAAPVFDIADVSGSDDVEVALAARGSAWAAAWTRADDLSLRIRRFGAAGPLEGTRQIASHARSPSIAALPSSAPANDYVIAWSDAIDQRVRVLELAASATTGATREVTEGQVARPEVFPVVGALGDDAFAVGFTYADGFRDSDFRVLERSGHLHSRSTHEDELRALLMGPSNQRGLSISSARNGLWFSWSDDGMPRAEDPQALPNGLRMYLLGCSGCIVEDALGCFNAAEVLTPDGAVSVTGRSTGSQFGYALSADADCILVGSPTDAYSGAETGSAWLYRRDAGAWVQEAVLRAADGAAETIDATHFGPLFGSDVALSGDFAVVGAPFDNSTSGVSESGAAYLFHRVSGAWQQTKLSAPSLLADQHFGRNVALDEAWLIASGDLSPTSGSAILYGYSRSGSSYSYDQSITVTVPAAIQRIKDIELAGDRLYVSVLTGSGGTREDRVLVYRLDTNNDWVATPVQTLVATPNTATDGFGDHIEADGDLVMISAPGQIDPETDANGVIYAFERVTAGLTLLELISPPVDPFTEGTFGDRFALYGDQLAATADAAVHVFDLTTAGEWSHSATLPHPARTWSTSRAYSDVSFIEGQLVASATPEASSDYAVAPGALRLFSCSSAIACGDGLVTVGEECDDGNADTEWLCSTAVSCQTCDESCHWLWPSCGDGFVDSPRETCDEPGWATEYCGGGVPCSVCTEQCVVGFGGYCGDGIVQDEEEECDDGNHVDGDGCTATCHLGCEFESSVDSICDGIDQDCDDELDEDYSEPSVTCGLGACARTGLMECVDGAPANTCTPGAATGTDNDCDNINDDCDTRVDESYGGPTTCGSGVCARTGIASCTNGMASNTCVPGTPSGTDATCNNTDEDCDAHIDEAYTSVASSCGVGACARTGMTSCVSGSVSQNCTAGSPTSELCNFIDDDCDGMVDDSCIVESLKLETGVVSVGATPVTVPLKHAYYSPVVVTTVQYENNTLPVVTRLQAVGSTSFQVYLQVPAGQTPVAEQVHYIVVEEGVWNVGGFKIEAHKVMSTVTSRNGSFTGQVQTYGQSYTAPTVLGQVMSTNDSGFSAFWSGGATPFSLPTATNLMIGLHVSYDPDITRNPETLGYVVLETANSTFAGVHYHAQMLPSFLQISAASTGLPTPLNFTAPVFTQRPEINLLSTSMPNTTTAGWVHGFRSVSTNGAWAYAVSDESNHGARTHSQRAGWLVFEKQIIYPVPTCGNGMVQIGEGCDDGNTTTEYCSGGISCSVCTATCATGSGGFCGDFIRQAGEVCDDGNVNNGDACSANCQTASPRFETGTITTTPGGVTVSLRHTYYTPVVVASLSYVNNTNPVVVRINNVTSNSFNMYLQSPTGISIVPDLVTYFVVEQGVWNVGGFLVEARKRTAIQNSFAGGTSTSHYWGGERQQYGQAYTAPIVLGQVMSTNDSRFSVFWASAGDPSLPPDPAVLHIGQHSGDERTTSRTMETLGYVVLDSTPMDVAGVAYRGVVAPSFMAANAVSAPGPVLGATWSPAAHISSNLFTYGPRAVLVGTAGNTYYQANWIYQNGRNTPTGPVVYADRSGHDTRLGARRISAIGFQEDVYYPAPTCGNSIVEPGEDCDFGDTDLEYCPMGLSCTTCSPRCKVDAGGYCGDSILQAANGEVCDDGNVTGGDACSSNCQAASPRLELGNVMVGATPITVELENDYFDPVVVTSIAYANNTSPVVTRIANVTTHSFDIRLQVPSGLATPVADRVTYGVAERGTWSIDGVKLEARKVTASKPDAASLGWIGYEQKYGHTYTSPVVIGQVMSSNNAAFSSFWDQGRGANERPTPNTLWVGMSISDDSNKIRSPETIGYWIMEHGAGTLGGVEFRTRADALGGGPVINYAVRSVAYTTPFSQAPEAVLNSPAGSGNGVGNLVYAYDDPASSRSHVTTAADTPAITGARTNVNVASQVMAFGRTFVYPTHVCGNGSQEPGEECDDSDTQINYCPGGTSCVVCDDRCRNKPGGFCGDGKLQASAGELCDDGNTSSGDACSATCGSPAPKLEVGNVSVGGSAVTVNLSNIYTSPVVVTAINYRNNTVPVVSRVSAVDGDSFDVRLVNPTGLSVVADTVSYIVIEKGVWNIGGRAIEAQRRTAVVTSNSAGGYLHFVPERAEYGQSYTNPVVVGQVMTTNDTKFSVFWSSDGTAAAATSLGPTSTALYVGKHVGEDTSPVRADEDVGFIVLEAGSGTLGGVAYRAGVTPATVQGIGGPNAIQTFNFSSAFATVPEVALVSVTGMTSSYGTLAYSHGSTPMTTSSIRIASDRTGHVARPQGYDRESYLVFEDPFVYTTP